MNIFKKLFISVVILSTIMVNTTTASAYTGYVGADEDVPNAVRQAEVAKYYLDRSGYNTTLYAGSSFTKASIKNVVPSVRVFYVSCHGGGGGYYFCTKNENVYAREIYEWTRGFYKFVFIDACQSADSKRLYNAFNMVDGDGLNNAFLGWKGLAYSSGAYFTFSNTVFERLTAGATVNDAVWTARSRTGITNYQIYGNYKTTLYN